ncbi:hypothetical protein BJ166DRAFT_363123 [Pestalotiopsis sp. NC0098]|nr:hypothetical protein BJ166DRAFT_363123 [Pestalotiopsis sp. NC0098]
MVRFVPILTALFLGLAAADGLSACSAGCISQVFSDTTTFGCAANDKACACGHDPDFWFAIRDCITQACPTADLDTQLADAQTDSGTQCAAASAAAGLTTTAPVTTPAPATTAAATTPTTAAEPTTTEAAETVAPSSSTETAAAATTATTATSVSSATTATAAATTSASASSASKASSVTSQTTAATTSGTSASGFTTKISPITSSTSAASSSSSTSEAAASTDDDSSEGLSVAAKAGIGAGAGVALILSAITICYVLAKKRKDKQNPSRTPTMQISKPLPGSGRQYAASEAGAARMAALSTQFRDDQLTPIKTAAYKPSTASSQYSPTSLYAPSDYDRHDVAGRRYEDMLPRTQPRTMI